MDSNYKHCTWTHNSNQVKTWEVKDNSQDWPKTIITTSPPSNWPKTTVVSTSLSPYTITSSTITSSTIYQFPSAPSEDDMIKDILGRTEEYGFFKDILEWLKKDAPKKLRVILRELVSPIHTGHVTYERLCEVMYHIGFKTSELIERRMILGPSNKWVVEYFNDFPVSN